MILVLGIVAAACALVLPLTASAASGTTTSITSISNTSPVAGETVTFTVSVTSSNNVTVNGGTVSLVDTNLRNWGSASVSGGVATISVPGLPVGQIQLQAQYGGFRTTFAPSNSTYVSLNVSDNALPRTKTTITADNTTITAGDNVNFTLKVTNLDGSTIPTGTVTLTASVGGTNVNLFPNSQLDVKPSNGGTGVITDQFNPAGTYVITAQFQGAAYQPSSDQVTIVVNPAKSITTTTTTTVLANGGALTVSPDVPMTLTATVMQDQAVSPPAGDVVTFYRQLNGGYIETLGQGDITWDVTDGSKPATGTATFQSGQWPRGDYTVTAQFIGDQYDKTSTGQTAVGVHGPEPTTTTYVGDLTGTTNSPITLTGKLVDPDGIPIAGEPLTLSLNGNSAETCTTDPTSDAGLASCQVTVVDLPGRYPVTASFGGDGDLQPSSGSDHVVIGLPAIIPTTLVYTGDTTGVAGTQETISFVLSSEFGPVANEPVAVSVDGGTPVLLTSDGAGNVSFQAIEPGGTHTITASFAGDGPYQQSSGPGQLVVSKLPTQLTYDGSTTASPGGPATVSFKLTDPTHGNAPLAGKTVSITFDGQTYTETTNASGDASFPVALQPGTYPADASFDGTNDVTYNSSIGGGQLVVSKLPTNLTYDGDTSVAGGSPATVSFKLTDPTHGNAALGSRTVSITINGHTYTATTNASGDASFPVTLPPGTYPSSASFDGSSDPLYDSSTGSGQLVVSKLPTQLTYDGDTLLTGGGAANISFKLTDPTNANAPLVGKTVSITVNGHTYTATTDGSGDASVSATLPAGTYTPSASFDGSNDPVYKSTAGTGQLVVKSTPTTTTVLTNPTVPYGSPITLDAKLVDVNGNPLAGETVTLTIGSGPDTCSGITRADGTVTCTIASPTSPAGTYTVTAKFAGDGAFLPSSGTGSVVITQATTAIVDNVTGNFLLGSPLTLSGTLTSGGQPVAGETLTLKFGSATCTTGATDANGTATCVVTGGVPGPTGPTTTYATFAGDANYKAATDNKPALVYAYAPGGGSFVVGDQTATGSVYFWGSQWWKKNVLSNGDPQAGDPAAFKGFAAHPGAPQCGVNWSTDPGNSTPPPDGPLPAYMAVIVTDHNSKSGPILNGDTIAIVIVKTDPGYQGNPGHPGTGTVVATLCSGGSDDGSGSKVDCTTRGTKCESLLANPSIAPGSTVTAGQTLSILYADDSMIAGTPAITIDSQSVTPTVTSTSGVRPAYVDNYGGSTSTKYESLISFAIPGGLADGAHTITISVQDGDGDYDVYTFTVNTGASGSGGGSGGSGSSVTCGSGKKNSGTVKCESLLANPSASSGTLSILYSDDAAMGSVAVTLDGTPLATSTTATSGQKVTYVDSYGGSTSTKSQTLISFTLPAGLSAGAHTIVVTVQDGDGDYDVYAWSITA